MNRQSTYYDLTLDQCLQLTCNCPVNTFYHDQHSVDPLDTGAEDGHTLPHFDYCPVSLHPPLAYVNQHAVLVANVGHR